MAVCQFLLHNIVIGYFLWFVAVATTAAFYSSILLHHPLPLSLVLLQCIENADTILSVQAVKNQATDWVWPLGGSLPMLVIEVGEPVSS